MMCLRMQDSFLVMVYYLLIFFFFSSFDYLFFVVCFYFLALLRVYVFPQPVWGITGERICSTRSSRPPSPDQLIDHHSAMVGY